jgi:ribosomal protein S19
MPRSLKKGPFVDGHLTKKVDAQDLVTPLNDHSFNDRTHNCSARWPQARSGFRN